MNKKQMNQYKKKPSELLEILESTGIQPDYVGGKSKNFLFSMLSKINHTSYNICTNFGTTIHVINPEVFHRTVVKLENKTKIKLFY